MWSHLLQVYQRILENFWLEAFTEQCCKLFDSFTIPTYNDLSTRSLHNLKTLSLLLEIVMIALGFCCKFDVNYIICFEIIWSYNKDTTYAWQFIEVLSLQEIEWDRLVVILYMAYFRSYFKDVVLDMAFLWY